MRPPLTRPGFSETIRKLTLVAAGVSAFLGGCATTGPNHIYLTTAASAAIHDHGPAPAAVRAVLAPGERALGLAYDFNTDHLFVRIAPGQVIRVVERPSGRILRDMPLPRELHTTAPADLAIRSHDRHLFAAHPDGRSIVELTLFGGFVRRFELRGLTAPIGGLAYDQQGGRLLVLTAAAPAHVGVVSPEGRIEDLVALTTPVSPVSLGYDSDARRFFVPLADGRSLGEFDATGRLLAVHPAADTITAVDAGRRAFVRLF
jgi:uncharacterized protein YjiK